MMNTYQTELSDIRSELESCYAADPDSGQANAAARAPIKMRLDNLINRASKELATKEFLQLKNEVLDLFSESPRCVEDDVLFVSLIGSLLKNGVLSKEEAGSVLEAGSCQQCGRV